MDQLVLRDFEATLGDSEAAARAFRLFDDDGDDFCVEAELHTR